MAETSKPAAPELPGTAVEKPLPSTGNAVFGSDVVADALKALDVPYKIGRAHV